MSRRRAAPKREILPDPKFRSESIAQFVNHVMVSGKKSLAEKIVYGALDQVAKKLKNKIKEEAKGHEDAFSDDEHVALLIFDKVLENLSPAVEVRSRRVGGATYQVPVEVRPSRRLALAMRWLVETAKGRGEKTMASRLAAEMAEAYYNRGNAWKKKEEMLRMAMANQAFAHYRWN